MMLLVTGFAASTIHVDLCKISFAQLISRLLLRINLHLDNLSLTIVPFSIVQALSKCNPFHATCPGGALETGLHYGSRRV